VGPSKRQLTDLPAVRDVGWTRDGNSYIHGVDGDGKTKCGEGEGECTPSVENHNARKRDGESPA